MELLATSRLLYNHTIREWKSSRTHTALETQAWRRKSISQGNALASAVGLMNLEYVPRKQIARVFSNARPGIALIKESPFPLLAKLGNEAKIDTVPLLLGTLSKSREETTPSRP